MHCNQHQCCLDLFKQNCDRTCLPCIFSSISHFYFLHSDCTDSCMQRQKTRCMWSVMIADASLTFNLHKIKIVVILSKTLMLPCKHCYCYSIENANLVFLFFFVSIKLIPTSVIWVDTVIYIKMKGLTIFCAVFDVILWCTSPSS